MFYEDVSYRVSVVFIFDFAMNVISKSRSCAAGDWVIICWRYCLDQTGDRTDFNGIVTHVRLSLSTQKRAYGARRRIFYTSQLSQCNFCEV